MTLGPTVRPARSPSHRRRHLLALQLAAALSSGVAAANAMEHPLPPWTFVPASVGVGNCDDAGPGSLRDAILSAAPGQVIVSQQRRCSTITLTAGALPTAQNGHTLPAPGAESWAMEGAGTPPVLINSANNRKSPRLHSSYL